MPLNLAAADKALKEMYLGPVRDVLNNKIMLLKNIEKNTEDFVGKLGVVPLLTGRNQGIGSRGESETLADPGNQEYNRAEYRMTYHYGKIKVTGPSAAATKNDEGAFIRAIDSEMKGLVKDMRRDFNRQLYTTGRGDLATVIASANGTTGRRLFGLQNPTSFRYLQRNMKVDLLSGGNGTPRATTSQMTIISTYLSTNGTSWVNVSRGTATNISAGTLTGAPRLVRSGNFGREFLGLVDIVSDVNPVIPSAGGLTARNTVGNVDRTTVTEWKATVLANGGVLRSLSLELIDEMFDTLDVNSDGNPSLIIGDQATVRAYSRLLTPDRRFPTADGKPIELDGGYKALMYDNVPIVKDRDCQPNRLYFLDESSLMLFEMSELEWMDKDGAILCRVSNKDEYEATLFRYAEFATSDAANNGRLDDVQ